jgi:CRP/FNR family transcriptional regulator, cyclic AMP receptor protein
MEVDRRLAKILISLARHGGTPGTKGTLIVAPLTHQDLADMIGSCRQTVTTVMRKFKEAGYIDSEKRVLEVVDIEGLKKFCNP